MKFLLKVRYLGFSFDLVSLELIVQVFDFTISILDALALVVDKIFLLLDDLLLLGDRLFQFIFIFTDLLIEVGNHQVLLI